jgi:PKD repeat protein
MATLNLYNSAFTKGLAGEADWINDTLKIMLVDSSYTPDLINHTYKSSVTGEITGTGYTTGGASLTNKTLAYDGVSKIVADADDVVWLNSTITARYAIIYDDTPATDAQKPLLVLIDFGSDISSSNGSFTISFAAEGIFSLTLNA